MTLCLNSFFINSFFLHFTHCYFTGISIAVLVGGMAVVKQERVLSKHPEIIVATPGRLWDLVQLGYEHLVEIDKIRYLYHYSTIFLFLYLKTLNEC